MFSGYLSRLSGLSGLSVCLSVWDYGSVLCPLDLLVVRCLRMFSSCLRWQVFAAYSAGFSWRSRFEPSGNVLLGSLGQLVAAKVASHFAKGITFRVWSLSLARFISFYCHFISMKKYQQNKHESVNESAWCRQNRPCFDITIHWSRFAWRLASTFPQLAAGQKPGWPMSAAWNLSDSVAVFV